MSKTFRFAILGLALVAVVGLLTVQLDAALATAIYAEADARDIVHMPVVDTSYETPEEAHARAIREGRTIASVEAEHFGFIDIHELHEPDFLRETFDSTIRFDITGEGPYQGLKSVVELTAATEVHSDYQKPGTDRRVLSTNMQSIQGDAVDHPDFKVFSLLGGTANGFDSPGTTVLTRKQGSTFLVESSFNVKFQLRIQGRDGSKWEGFDEIVEADALMVAAPAGISHGL